MSGSDVVLAFTTESSKEMSEKGNSGLWKVNRKRIRETQYLLCICNKHRDANTENERKPKHGAAFLIARTSGVSDADRNGERALIDFNEYAEINIENAWRKCTGGQRYPIAYMSLQELWEALELDPENPDLGWKSLPDDSSKPVLGSVSRSVSALTIPQAKAGLAEGLGISTEKIEIHITA